MSDTNTPNETRRIVEPAPHEFAAHWNTNSHDLDAWFAADSIVKENGGSLETTFESLGESWEATLYFQDSAVKPPTGGTTAAGTEIQHDTIREFRISVEAVDDDHGIVSCNYHIRPRWDNMKAERDDGSTTRIPTPDELTNQQTDAINVRISGSNIPFSEYGELLRDAAESVGISSRYFADDGRHPTSNIQDAARYVRLSKDKSGPVHARTGPISALAHVLEDDRDGYRKLVQNDTDERGNKKPGYYHTATLGHSRITEIFPNHRLPVEIKHYYAQEADSRTNNEPLAHPKLEAAYQVSRWDEKVAYTDENISDLETELDEIIYSVLNDAGLDVRAGGATFVADDVFTAENATTTANVVDLNLSEIRHEQEAIVYEQLAGGMSPVEKDTLNKLVADGGEVAPKEIADETDRHIDTVYDALGRMNDLVKHEYDSVSLESTYLSELVADALEAAENQVARATNAAAEAVNAESRGLDATTSAFLAWCESYGVNYHNLEGDSDSSLSLGEVSSIKEAREILRKGLDLWEAMNKSELDFRGCTVTFRIENSTSFRSNLIEDKTRTVRHRNTVWKVISGE